MSALRSTIPAITLWQPWASWMAWGWKTIETRTHLRLQSLLGKTVAIHAGLRVDRNAVHLARFSMPLPMCQLAAFAWREGPAAHRGCVIATARMVEVIPSIPSADGVFKGSMISENHDVIGKVGYRFENIRPLKNPIPARGHQGIWYWQVPEGVNI